MDIDVTKPEGNTLVALAHASRLMREVGVDKKEIAALTTAVFAAESAKEARALIEAATNGSIKFVDPRKGD